jgi:hypothetical protein
MDRRRAGQPVVVVRRTGQPAGDQFDELPVLSLLSDPGGWQVGMSPNIQVNWKAEPGNKLTLPIGFGAGKLFRLGKLPVKLTLEVDYALVKPEDYGQRWTIRFQLIPVIPALVKDVLFK